MRNNTGIKKSEILFYTAWILFLCSVLLEYTAWYEENNTALLVVTIKIIRYSSYAIFCLKIFNGTYRYDFVKKSLILFVIFILSFLGSRNKTMILYLLILFATIGINGKTYIKLTYIVQVLFLFIFIFFSMSGFVTDYIFDPQGRMRHSLGFSWTTTAPILFFYTMLCYIYLKKGRITSVRYFLLMCFNLWLYKMTDARMSFVLSCFVLLFFAIKQLYGNKWKCLKHFNCIYYVFPACICIFSLIMYCRYDEEGFLWKKMNELLSNRLYLGHKAIFEYGISLFGKEIKWVGFSLKKPTLQEAIGYNYVDCSYLQLLLEYGLFFLAVVMIIYTIAIYRAVRSQDYYLVWILLVVLIFGVTEPRLMNFAFNPFPLMAFCNLGFIGDKEKITE